MNKKHKTYTNKCCLKETANATTEKAASETNNEHAKETSC